MTARAAGTTPAARPPASPAGRRPAASSRSFAAGLFVAGVVIAAGLIVLTGGGKSKPKVVVAPARLPALTAKFQDRALGITGLATRRWVVGGVGPILHLTSVDRKALIAIDAPGAARTAHGALHTAIATMRKLYKNVTVKQSAISTLGGLPAYVVVMNATSVRGARLQVLVASAQGKKLAYVMEAFTALHAPQIDIQEAREIIATLRFAY